MFKTIFKVTTLILILLVLHGFNPSAKADGSSGKNFILPKTFKINDEFLPPLDVKSEPKQNNTVSSDTIPVKAYKANPVNTSTINNTIQTIKAKPVVTSTQVKSTVPAIYKQPTAIITTTPTKNNNTKTSIIQTNPIKTNSANKSNNAASLTNLIKNYECAYADTLKSTIIALSSMGITPDSYNTEKGQIIAKLPSGKEIFILVVPFKDTSSYVRITPTDGNYNLPMTTINEIFSNIGDNLPPN